MFPTNPSLGPNDPRLMSLLMRQRMPIGGAPGPVPAQTPIPGFRAPGAAGFPGMQAQDNGSAAMAGGASMLGMGLRGIKPGPAGTVGREPYGPPDPSMPEPYGPPASSAPSPGGFGMVLQKLGLGSGSSSAGGAGAAEGASGAAGSTEAAGGFSNAMGGLGPIAAVMAAIGMGKNTEANHAGTPLGDGLLAGLAPSGAQIAEDPVGMGLPTLLGVPFLTPFTGSDKAKKTRPEWSSFFGLGA